MRRVDFISSDNKIDSLFNYSDFTKEELETRNFKKIPLIRGFSEIKKLFVLCKEHNAYICGGYARYCAAKNFRKISDSKDIDIYSSNQESYDILKTKIKEMFVENNYGEAVNIHESDFATTFTLPPLPVLGQEGVNETAISYASLRRMEFQKKISYIFPIQLIKPSVERSCHGDVFTILSNFDIDICQAAILSEDEILVTDGFWTNEAKGRMGLARISNPFMTLSRISKYTEKGYNLNIDAADRLLSFYDKSKKDGDWVEVDSEKSKHMHEFNKRQGKS